tara:strand:- start:4149 stop:5591 length:1443 start_codon:yes stop_codon:yes gene_type:complete
MAKNLTKEFEEKGFTKKYIRDILLPATGLKDYKKPLRFTIEQLNRNLGIETKLYEVDVYSNNGNGINNKNSSSKSLNHLIRSFVIKDHLSKEDSLKLYGKEPRSPKLRYETEKQAINLLDYYSLGPELCDSDGRRNRLIMRNWDCSLDKLINIAYEHYNSEDKSKREKEEIKNLALSYIEEGLKRLVKTCTVLTKELPNLKDTKAPPEAKKGVKSKKEKIGKQLYTIVERSLKDCGDEEIRIELEKLEEGIEQGTLEQELKNLAMYFYSGNQTIHNDTRSSNFLVRDTKVGARTSFYEKLPIVENLDFTLCDYTDIRKGPLSHDLAVLINDPYLIRFNINENKRKKLFKKVLEESFPLLLETQKHFPYLKKQQVMFENIKNLENLPSRAQKKKINKYVDSQLIISQTLTLIEKSANPIAVENQDEEQFKEYLKMFPIEDNNKNTIRNLNCLLDEVLKGKSEFPNIRNTLTAAQERLKKEK